MPGIVMLQVVTTIIMVALIVYCVVNTDNDDIPEIAKTIQLVETCTVIGGLFIYRAVIICRQSNSKSYSKYLLFMPYYHSCLDFAAFTGLLANVSVLLTGELGIKGEKGCWYIERGIGTLLERFYCDILYEHALDYAVFSVTVAPLIIFRQPSLSQMSMHIAVRNILFAYLLLLFSRLLLFSLILVWTTLVFPDSGMDNSQPFVSASISGSMSLYCGLFAVGAIQVRSSVRFFAWITPLYGFVKLLMDIDSEPVSSYATDILEFMWPLMFVSVIFAIRSDTLYWSGHWQQPAVPKQVATLRFAEQPLLDSTAIGLQQLADEHSVHIIDFSALSFGAPLLIGKRSSEYMAFSGSLSDGTNNDKNVLIKCFTPFELTLNAISSCGAQATFHASLQHRNIIRFLGICISPPHICLVFEPCSRGSLADRLSEISRWAWPEKIQLMSELIVVIAALHKAHFVHGSLSADDFLIRDDWSLALADFTTMSSTELAAHEDVFNLGVLMWRVVTGLPSPFPDPDKHRAKSLSMGLQDDFPAPSWENESQQCRLDLPVFTAAEAPALFPGVLRACFQDSFKKFTAEDLLIQFDNMAAAYDHTYRDWDTKDSVAVVRKKISGPSKTTSMHTDHYDSFMYTHSDQENSQSGSLSGAVMSVASPVKQELMNELTAHVKSFGRQADPEDLFSEGSNYHTDDD